MNNHDLIEIRMFQFNGQISIQVRSLHCLQYKANDFFSSIVAQSFNFDKYNYMQVDTQMTSYDYGSVMHYERNAFALNSSGATIIPIQNTSAYIGQRFQLSAIDILEIQRYYGCVSTPSGKRIVP